MGLKMTLARRAAWLTTLAALLPLVPNSAAAEPTRAVRGWPVAGEQITLLDVAGRSLATRDVGVLGPGTHRITLVPASGMRPGIYAVRLEQEGRTRTLKATVLARLDPTVTVPQRTQALISISSPLPWRPVDPGVDVPLAGGLGTRMRQQAVWISPRIRSRFPKAFASSPSGPASPRSPV